MYVIVTNHVNWHRENLQSDRENTGNSQMQFEWVPVYFFKFIIICNLGGVLIKVEKAFPTFPSVSPITSGIT